MFNSTIDKKPILKKPDGKIIRDLTKSIFDFNIQSLVTYKAYKVPAEYVMRPDLISQAVYNNTAYTELILKYNGISNPFSLNQDEIILIPSLDEAKKSLKGQGTIADKDDADKIRRAFKYIDPTKKPNISPETEDFNNRKLTDNTKLKDGALPPNIAEAGTSQITYRNGRVFFGENIGTSACLKNGMSSSEFLTQVIKSKQKI